MRIQGQTGASVFEVQVTKDGHLVTDSIIETELEHVSKEDGLAFSWASVTQALNAGETGLLVKNTSDKDLHVEFVSLSADTDTRILLHIPAEVTTPAGVSVVGKNLNTRSSNVAEATGISDETTNVLAQANVIWSGEIHAAQNPFMVDLLGAVILSKNESIAVDAVSAVTAFDFTTIGHFEDAE